VRKVFSQPSKLGLTGKPASLKSVLVDGLECDVGEVCGRPAPGPQPTKQPRASQFGQALDLRDTYKTRQPVRELEPRLTMMPAAEAVRDESLVHEVLFSFAPFLGHEPGAIHARRRWHCRSGRHITP